MSWLSLKSYLVSASRLPAVAGLLLICITFAACHLDSSIADTQLTHSVWVLLFAWLLPLPRHVFAAEIRFVLMMVVIFLAALLSAYLAGDLSHETYFRPALIYLYPLGALGVLSLFQMRRAWLVSALIFASTMAVLVILKDLTYGGIRGEHHGLPIPYGIFGLCTGLICLLLARDKDISRVERSLLMVAAAGGFAACLWSQTRIAWLFAVAWILLAVVVWLMKTSMSTKKLAVLGVGLLMMVAVLNLNLVQNRVDEAISDVQQYADGTNKNTSIGQRLELWKVALYAAKEGPFLGVGESGFVRVRDELNKSRTVFVRKGLEHAHNDFLWKLSTYGLLSLSLYLLLQAGLFVFFWRHLQSAVTRNTALAGMTLVAAALFNGFADIFFSVKIIIGYYLIAQLVLIRYISQRKAGLAQS